MPERGFIGYLNHYSPQSNYMSAEDHVRWFGQKISNEFDGDTWIIQTIEVTPLPDGKSAIIGFDAYQEVLIRLVAVDQGLFRDGAGEVFNKVMMAASFSDKRPHNDQFEITVMRVMNSALIPAVGALSGDSGEDFWKLTLDR